MLAHYLEPEADECMVREPLGRYAAGGRYAGIGSQAEEGGHARHVVPHGRAVQRRQPVTILLVKSSVS
jgi:hypothetical protein